MKTSRDNSFVTRIENNINPTAVFTAILTVSFIIGLILGSSCEATSARYQIKNTFHALPSSYFLLILRNNLILAFSLMLGFVTFGVYNLCAVSYNGLFFGVSISTAIATSSSKQALLLIAPHSILEFIWMVLISAFSLRLSFRFYHLLTSGLEDVSLFNEIMSKRLLYLFALVIAAVGIEYYITPKIFAYFR